MTSDVLAEPLVHKPSPQAAANMPMDQEVISR